MYIKSIKYTILLAVTGIFLFSLILAPHTGYAVVFTSSNFQILDPVIDVGDGRTTSINYILLQSLGQVALGTSTAFSFQLHPGFLAFPTVTTPVVTPTAGDGEVDLSWTSAAGALGWTVSGYTVGQSTVSGGPYTYTSLGNITDSSRAGLSNGITYYFVILPEDVFGNTIATSTEVSAIPVAGAVPQPSSSGGGGGILPSQVIITGFAAPFSTVYLLKDGQRLGEMLTTSSGSFLFRVSNVSVGNHLFSLYFQDPNRRDSPLLSLRVGLQNSVTTTLGDILLAPTLGISSSNRNQIIMTGFTIPDGTLILSLVGDASTVITTTETVADADGSYSFSLETGSLSPGPFKALIRSFFRTLSSGENALEFVLNADFQIEVTKLKAKECAPSDFNGDSKVNLIDFSILLYWFSRFEPPSEIDLNNDKVVNLSDFSIMVYCWTG